MDDGETELPRIAGSGSFEFRNKIGRSAQKLIADSIRYHRSDSALVRVIVPVQGGDSDAATKIAVIFVQTMFPAISAQLPG